MSKARRPTAEQRHYDQQLLRVWYAIFFGLAGLCGVAVFFGVMLVGRHLVVGMVLFGGAVVLAVLAVFFLGTGAVKEARIKAGGRFSLED